MRYTQLDALRGLAALSVVMGHFIGFLPDIPTWLCFVADTPLHIFWDGAAAVDLFFVLSGFCIAIPYVRDSNKRRMHYGGFLIRRFFRLYPAYIITILLSLLLKDYYVSPGADYISSWGGDFWQWTSLSLFQLVNVISLIGKFDPNWLNPPTWSLIVEMRMAFVLPLLIVMAYRFERYTWYIFFILLTFSMFESLGPGKIFPFAYLFYLGIILSRNLSKLYEYVNKVPKLWFAFFVLIGLLLYESRFPFKALLFGVGDVYTYRQEAIFHMITGIGSAIIICAFFRNSIQKCLSNHVGSFLGYISYSIYLIHFPILLWLCQFRIEYWCVLPVFILLSIIGAYVMYRFVELPGIRLGRFLS